MILGSLQEVCLRLVESGLLLRCTNSGGNPELPNGGTVALPMRNPNRFLPGFHQILFGRPPKSAREELERRAAELQESSLGELNRAFVPWVPTSLLEPNSKKAHSRRRHFSLSVTFWAFLSQILSPGSSCRSVVRRVQAWCVQQRIKVPNSSTGAYCKARKKLCLDLLFAVLEHVAGELVRRVHSEDLWCGRRVRVVDATGISMPDTPENQEAFPQPKNMTPGCGFPVAKVLGCFCLHSGALLKYVVEQHRIHDSKLLKRILSFFVPGDVVLGDRGFCSYGHMAALKQNDVDTVFRLHQGRKIDFRKGRRIGPNERLYEWKKPRWTKSSVYSKQEWAELPDQLTVRYVRIRVPQKGFRPETIVIATTLLDTDAYPAEEIAELYFLRWAVELFFRDIKISMGMDVLRCKTPDMILKEMCMHAIAYNLIRLLMKNAADQYGEYLDRLSFKGTVDTLREWGGTLESVSQQPRRYRETLNQLLRIIAEDTNPHRPDRAEPRVRKRRPKNYRLMTRPRHADAAFQEAS